jgi:hypothetical protein
MRDSIVPPRGGTKVLLVCFYGYLTMLYQHLNLYRLEWEVILSYEYGCIIVSVCPQRTSQTRESK